jgi:chemotaxis protein CheC
MGADKKKIDKAIELIAKLSIDKSSVAFSKIVKQGARIVMENAYMANISEATAKAYSQDSEVVGAFIDLEGDAPFKFLFYVQDTDSLVLTDLILRKEVGTTKEFDLYTQSAVQEVGNILASAISNVFSADFQIALKPTPPVVLHDFAGTVFEEYLVDIAIERNEVLIIESQFNIVQSNIKCSMFLLPYPGSEKVLNYISKAL